MTRKTKVTLETINDNMQSMQASIVLILDDLGALKDRTATLQNTVDRMALQVARIPEIELRLASLEERMGRVEFRLDNLTGAVERLDKKFEILEHEYLAIKAALKRLEERFDQLEADRLRTRIEVLEQKVAALEKSVLN
jgi:chromosome segregation ATPase